MRLRGLVLEHGRVAREVLREHVELRGRPAATELMGLARALLRSLRHHPMPDPDHTIRTFGMRPFRAPGRRRVPGPGNVAPPASRLVVFTIERSEVRKPLEDSRRDCGAAAGPGARRHAGPTATGNSTPQGSRNPSAAIADLRAGPGLQGLSRVLGTAVGFLATSARSARTTQAAGRPLQWAASSSASAIICTAGASRTDVAGLGGHAVTRSREVARGTCSARAGAANQ